MSEIRPMKKSDIPDVLSLMKPHIESGKLLPRDEKKLIADMNDYVVFELDGGILACASLHFYPDGQAEIGAVTVSQKFESMGFGERVVTFLYEKAVSQNAESVFILTTHAGEWFQKLGFKPSDVDSLPPERRAIWTPERGSKVFRK